MNDRHDPVNDVRRIVASHLLKLKLAPAARIVAAVSGGPDSTVMLDALFSEAPRFNLQIVVAHFHHGIRGSAADDDAAFVAGLTRGYGLDFHEGWGDAPGLARRRGLSLEDAARQLRRGFLDGVRTATAASVIALGHTRDDQAETVLMNLMRGAGPRGLGAIPPHGPGFLTRPLLRVRRTTIAAYAAALHLPFRTDETNADVTFRRNRIRHDLMPILERQFNPRIVESLSGQARLFREVDSYLTLSARQILDDERYAVRTERGIRLDAGRLGTVPRVLLREILRGAVHDLTGSLSGWGSVHVRALMNLLAKPGARQGDFPGNVTAERIGDVLELRGREPGPNIEPRIGEGGIQSPARLRLESDAEARWGQARLRVTFLRPEIISTATPVPDGVRAAWFDADVLGETMITIRSSEPGDRIRLFGGGGRKKLSDILVDQKVPRGLRRLRPVVVKGFDSSGEILWVVGTVRSPHAAITAETRRIVQLEWFGHWK